MRQVRFAHVHVSVGAHMHAHVHVSVGAHMHAYVHVSVGAHMHAHVPTLSWKLGSSAGTGTPMSCSFSRRAARRWRSTETKNNFSARIVMEVDISQTHL